MVRAVLFAALAAALSASASPTLAQSQAPAAATAGQAAGRAMFDFCLPLFGPGPMHADRIGATASLAGLSSAPAGARPLGFERAQSSFRAPAPSDSMVLAFWVPEAGVCQILVLGPAEAGGDLIAALPQLGWTLRQQGARTGPDTAADAFTAQPRGYDSELLVIANRWVSDREPETPVRLILNMMRTQ